MDGPPLNASAASEWRDFICDPSRAGRYLSPVGSALSETTTEPLDPMRLEGFLDGLGGKDGESLPLLAGALDLTRQDYSNFFRDYLPPLLDCIANESIAEQMVVGPALRGSPDWSRTMLGRRTGVLLPTQYASRVPRRSFELPENQLVRWLVASVSDGLSDIASRLPQGRLPPVLATLQGMVGDAEADSLLGEVSPPPFPEPHMFACAERQRLPGYREAARLADKRASLTVGDDALRWLATLELLQANWLAPIDQDDLFELYALVLILDVLERNLGLGPPVEYGLVTAHREHVAAFGGPSRVRVLFDQSPARPLKLATCFSGVAEQHSHLRSSPRRPDIVVIRDGEHPHAIFVEVKRTANERYISDSVYKGFAYLHDFAGTWVSRPTSPKLLLLLPERVRPRADAKLAKMDLVVCGAEFREVVRDVLAEALSF